MRICITGSGIVSAIGIGKQQTLEALLASRTGIGPLRWLLTSHHEFPVGEVKMDNSEMARMLSIESTVPMTRTALMGMIALGEALDDARLDCASLENTSLVGATTVGGMDKSELHYLDFLENDNYNQFIKTHDCGACTEMIASHFGRFASVATISTACSSAANAMIYGAQMIQNGTADIVVAGGSECITKFHLNGFNTLRILDTDPCRPFDASRNGLNLGEGAAWVVMESEAHAIARGANIQATLSGYGNACDAFHQTASSPEGEGAFLAMRQALSMAGIDPSQIDYVNAHGTATPNNDSSESNALRRIFGASVPPVSSTKSFTGHTTSASGTIEAVICLLAMRHRFIPANLNFEKAEDCITPVSSTRTGVELRHVLCNSFGFGGNDSSLLLSHYEQERETLSQPVVAHNTPKPVYIYAAKQISMQSPLCDDWMQNPILHDENYVRSLQPDFKKYIPPIEARRMGPLLKRALAVSKEALEECGLTVPEAIISGTGLGCIESTELFLDALCRQGEELLKPTHFMQSTHNTISSLLAINMHCHAFNNTFAHKNISFDCALDNALRIISLGIASNALVGGHDELTPSYYTLLAKTGWLGQPGMTAAECSAAFVIGTNNTSATTPLCRIDGMRILHRPTPTETIEALRDLLSQRDDMEGNKSIAIMTGANGSAESQQIYEKLCGQLMPEAPRLRYKHLFGESYTASALGLYTSAICLATGQIQSHLLLDPSAPCPANIGAILLVNNDDNINVTLTLISRPNDNQ